MFQNGASVVRVGSDDASSSPLPVAAVRSLVALARRSGRVLELYTDDDYAVELDHPFARGHAAILGVPFRARAFEVLLGDDLDARAVVRAQWLLPLRTSPRCSANRNLG